MCIKDYGASDVDDLHLKYCGHSDHGCVFIEKCVLTYLSRGCKLLTDYSYQKLNIEMVVVVVSSGSGRNGTGGGDGAVPASVAVAMVVVVWRRFQWQ